MPAHLIFSATRVQGQQTMPQNTKLPSRKAKLLSLKQLKIVWTWQVHKCIQMSEHVRACLDKARERPRRKQGFQPPLWSLLTMGAGRVQSCSASRWCQKLGKTPTSTTLTSPEPWEGLDLRTWFCSVTHRVRSQAHPWLCKSKKGSQHTEFIRILLERCPCVCLCTVMYCVSDNPNLWFLNCRGHQLWWYAFRGNEILHFWG